MGDSARRGRWIVLAGAVVAALALAVPGLAAASLSDGSGAFPAPNTCVSPLLPCYIVLSIGSGSRGNNETVDGARFWPGEPFTVYFMIGTAAGDPAAVVATGSTGTGGFTVSFRVPSDPVGTYTVFVTDWAGDNQSALFHLTHLRASPSSGSVGSTTAARGQGFLPDAVVTFHLHGVVASTTAPCQTDDFGNFSGCHVRVPNVPKGPTLLTATDGTYTARIEFTVT